MAEFAYDALGRRIRKIDHAAGLTTYYYYDANGRIIAEKEQSTGGAAEMARTFVYGDGVDEALAMYNPPRAASGDPNDLLDLVAFSETWLADPNDQNYDDAFDTYDDDFINLRDFSSLADGWTYSGPVPEKRWYYLTDALGSVMGLVGSHNGAESEFYLYDAYGQPYGESEAGNPFFWTARPVDWHEGYAVAQYNNWRNYTYELGRWFQNDPLGVVPNGFVGNERFAPRKQYTDGANLYEYLKNRPIYHSDPYGLTGVVSPYIVGEIENTRCGRNTASFRNGYQAFTSLENILQKKCEGCRPNNHEIACKLEAKKIAANIRTTWFHMFGKGPLWHWLLGDSYRGSLGLLNPVRGDTEGGFMCYEWSQMFDQAAKRVSGKYWTSTEMRAGVKNEEGKRINKQHNWATLKLDHECCKPASVAVDDGYCRDGYVHENLDTWPPREIVPPSDIYYCDIEPDPEDPEIIPGFPDNVPFEY